MSDEADPPTDPVDPREDVVLSPWIWLTLCTVALACLLFISFRRAQSLELYERAKAYVRDKLPFTLHRGIRLSDRDLAADPFSSLPTSSRSSRRPRSSPLAADEDDASETSSVHSDADELPAPSPSLRTYSFAGPGPSRSAGRLASTVQRGVASALDTLGWGQDGAGGVLRGAGDKSAGIARAFWGLRKQDRVGGIRLGAGEDLEAGQSRSASRGRGNSRESELSGVAGAVSRIFDVAGGQRERERASLARSSGHHRSTSASSNASGTALFDIGDDADAGDAVELPTHFSLATPSTGTSDSRSPSRGGARGE
ncbi:hypothetical protein JCM10207_003154 [Rhodosporidiobolus poonsookiae]